MSKIETSSEEYKRGWCDAIASLVYKRKGENVCHDPLCEIHNQQKLGNSTTTIAAVEGGDK